MGDNVTIQQVIDVLGCFMKIKIVGLTFLSDVCKHCFHIHPDYITDSC